MHYHGFLAILTDMSVIMDTRDSLLKAAAEVFVNQGFHKTKISDIVRAANVAQGTFYLYFKSKDEILHEISNNFTEQINEKLSTYCDSKVEISDQQQRREADVDFLVDLFSWLEAEHQIIKLILASPQGEDKVVDGCQSQLRETLVSLTKDGLDKCFEEGSVRKFDSTLVSEAIVGMIEHMALQRFVYGRFADISIRKFAEELVDLKLFGIAQRGERS